jgi:uncharacterized protein YndB with AHSA1/START domain
MAFTSRQISASATDIWAVLVDPTTYPDWLVGAQRIRDIDDDWPAIGSRFHHRVGVGWLSMPDYSEVEAIEPTSLLRLAVRVRPFISATATFRLVSDGSVTVISFEEEPNIKILGELVRPVVDPSVHIRNHLSLRRLADFVEDRERHTDDGR